jgi:hypothetical protein
MFGVCNGTAGDIRGDITGDTGKGAPAFLGDPFGVACWLTTLADNTFDDFFASVAEFGADPGGGALTCCARILGISLAAGVTGKLAEVSLPT